MATPTAPLLLRADHAPTASWVRRRLKQFVEHAGAWDLHFGLAGSLLREARDRSADVAVYYVDNHMRPYTGKRTTRRTWRMQDKRVRPGATDYYVHDEDGRPMMRIDVPSNDALTAWLSPIARLLRQALGDDERILLAFDRAGAFPKQMAELRDRGFEFVSYERKPYPLLSSTAFEDTIELDGEQVGVYESQLRNLGGGRGRVRRIAVRMADGHQVNLVATSSLPAARLVQIMSGRWAQENAFKHGVERWGINQLDQRKVEAVSPDKIIPNPARRRLDRARRVAHVREGDLRCKLAALPEDAPKRAQLEADLAEAVARHRELDAQRPSVPARACVKDTELADKLVQHTGLVKTLLDAIRIACANAESELAAELGPHLPKPAEAKKALANLLAAPGRIRPGKRAIRVRLAPAGSDAERQAFAAMLDAVNRRKLTLPGDARRRPLRFELQD